MSQEGRRIEYHPAHADRSRDPGLSKGATIGPKGEVKEEKGNVEDSKPDPPSSARAGPSYDPDLHWMLHAVVLRQTTIRRNSQSSADGVTSCRDPRRDSAVINRNGFV